MQDTNDSILAQDETSFNISTDDLKAQVTQLVKEGSAEAKDQLVQLGKDHGVNILPEMSFEEIQQQFDAVM